MRAQLRNKRLFEQTPEDKEADRELEGYANKPIEKPVLASKGESEVFAIGRVSGRFRKAQTKTGWVLLFQTAQMDPDQAHQFHAREVEEWRVYGDENIKEVAEQIVPGMMVAVTAWRRTVVKYITRSVKRYCNMNIVTQIDILDTAPDYNAAIRKEIALYDGSMSDERRPY